MPRISLVGERRADDQAVDLVAADAGIGERGPEGVRRIAVGIGRLLAGADPGMVADIVALADADHGADPGKIAGGHSSTPVARSEAMRSGL